MADIFISYARSDRTKAQALAEALEQEGYSIWWDPKIPPGKTFDDVIEEALDSARCVVVLWSRDSVSSEWVRTEAAEAKRREILVPVLIDNVTIPLAFRLRQAADLTNWQEDKPHLGFTNLLLAVSEIAGPPLGIPKVVQSNSQAVAGSVERENSVQEQVSHHERELLGRLRTEMMMAASSWDLRKAAYELDEHLAKYPHSPEARLLKDQLVVAVERSMRPEREPSEDVKPKAPPKPKSQKLLIGALVVVALILLLGVLWYTWPPAETFTNRIGMEFVLIPPGTFMMGSPPSEEDKHDSEAQHKVTISKPFYLQTTEVTVGQWKKFMGNNPSYFKNCGDDCPVVGVSWDDAQRFISKLNQKENTDKYRLPTEAEWEYACRARSTARFCFGNSEYQLREYAWYIRNSNDKPHPVGQLKPNAWGLYDMNGNSFEWCQDWYDRYYYSRSPERDPKGPSSGKSRVLRGGSWETSTFHLRAAARASSNPVHWSDIFGFRVARDL